MLLYLIRHADAVPLGQNSDTSDETRPLTETGKAQTRALAATLQKHGVRLDDILHSPLARSQQTAAGIAQHWGAAAAPLVDCEQLTPGTKHKKLTRFLRSLTGHSFALVGHMPDMAALAGWLIGGKKAQIDFAKAGVACIEFPERLRKGDGVLRWLITEEWLEKPTV